MEWCNGLWLGLGSWKVVSNIPDIKSVKLRLGMKHKLMVLGLFMLVAYSVWYCVYVGVYTQSWVTLHSFCLPELLKCSSYLLSLFCLTWPRYIISSLCEYILTYLHQHDTHHSPSCYIAHNKPIQDTISHIQMTHGDFYMP